MKFIGAITLAASLASTSAFTTSNTVGRPSFSLAATEAATEKKVGITSIREQLHGMTKDNFDSVLKEVEPFLLNEAGVTFYAKSMRRIAGQAKEFGATVPADYAKDAKCTKKRRERQDAFVQVKITEAADAAAEAAEAEAAATEAADAAEATESDDAEAAE
jgi:hypothetical protein